MSQDGWEPTPGQCLVCGGRGGWWSEPDKRTKCKRCKGSGWDPARDDHWFRQMVAPKQEQP